MQFACEATLNIAKQTEILALMREASFLGLFVGIELIFYGIAWIALALDLRAV